MKDAVIFKMGTVLENPTIGLDKLIINFPGGLTSEFTAGTKVNGICLRRDSADILFKIKTYNGRLLTFNNNNFSEKDTYVDDFGNTVRYYEIDGNDPYPLAQYWIHLTVGITRVEILEISKYAECWYGGGTYQNRIHEGEVNIEGFALSTNPVLQCPHCPNYGDLKHFKNCDHIKRVNLNSEDSSITGDINNFIKCAAKPGAFDTNFAFAYCRGVYGELSTLLDAMKNRSDILGTGKTFEWYFWDTQVTYKGNRIQSAVQGGYDTIVFDANGNYTVNGV